MLRDSHEAFEHLARLRFEREWELRYNTRGPGENNDQAGDACDTEQERQESAGDQFLPRSANGAEFEPIGRILYPFWYNVDHATLDVRKAKKEVRRWERSIAFLDDADVPDVSESVGGGIALKVDMQLSTDFLWVCRKSSKTCSSWQTSCCRLRTCETYATHCRRCLSRSTNGQRASFVPKMSMTRYTMLSQKLYSVYQAPWSGQVYRIWERINRSMSQNARRPLGTTFSSLRTASPSKRMIMISLQWMTAHSSLSRSYFVEKHRLVY